MSSTSSRSRPTSPSIRIDKPDVVYKTEPGKFRAVIRQIKECHEKGQPVLVGTISIEKSELLQPASEARGHPAQRPERQAPRKRSRDRRAGGQPRRGHHRHEHGRPRHRHHARRQRRVHGEERSAQAGLSEELIAESNCLRRDRRPGDPRRPRGLSTRLMKRHKAEIDREADQVRAGRRPLYHRHRAARVPPHRQPAPRPCRPSGRPRRDAVLPLDAGRRHAPVRLRARAQHDGLARPRRGHAHRRRRSSPARSKTRRRPSRAATIRPGKAFLSTTTS